MIYLSKPRQFTPRFEVVSCYIEVDKKILLLHRPVHKLQGGKWGVPAGKINGNEKPIEAMKRELMEETGLDISTSEMSYLNKVFVRYPDYDFIYHMYRVVIKKIPNIKINLNEHCDYRWEYPENTNSVPLVDDLDACIKLYF